MVKEYEVVQSLKKVAATFRVSVPTIAKYLRAEGVELRKPGRPRQVVVTIDNVSLANPARESREHDDEMNESRARPLVIAEAEGNPGFDREVDDALRMILGDDVAEVIERRGSADWDDWGDTN